MGKIRYAWVADLKKDEEGVCGLLQPLLLWQSELYSYTMMVDGASVTEPSQRLYRA